MKEHRGRLRPTAAILLAVSMVAATGGTVSAQGVCSGVAPVPGTALSGFPVVTGLTGRPLQVTAPPGDRDRLFIVEQNGLIRIHHRGAPTGVTTVFLDITDRVQASTFFSEMGLLGLAFDPDYATSGKFYVNYTEGPVSGPWATVVSRFSRIDIDPDEADAGSEERLLSFNQPETNHNGGQLFFGPDGFLYVATGDGGGGGDDHGVCGNGQDKANLLGKLLRLDVRNIDPFGVAPDCGGGLADYAIPSGNPFASTGTSDCGEIWDWGLRNPWRSAYDFVTGDLIIADVGQNCWEEINALAGSGPGPAGIPAGGVNFGWRSMEASQCFDPAAGASCDPNPVACPGMPICLDPSLTLPVVEYTHSQGCSVTGGEVYRGCQMPDMHGTYFYGDFCRGFVRSFRLSLGVPTLQSDHTNAIDPTGTLANRLTGFGLDGEGELYVVNRSGTVLRVGPPFTALEVAGPGSGAPLMLGGAAWTWEDLAFRSMRPVSFYRVYRGTPGGVFQCRFTTPTPQWAGGDPDNPPLGGLFAYVVTAVNASGQETRPGIAGTSFLLGACP